MPNWSAYATSALEEDLELWSFGVFACRHHNRAQVGAGRDEQHTCDILSVCCRPSTTAVDVGRNVVNLLTVLVRHCGIRRRAGVCSQYDSILCENRQLIKGLNKMDTAPTDHSQTIIEILISTLNTSPAIVVPVFVNLGGLLPLASRYALRPHKSNWKPPCVIVGQLSVI